MISAGVLANSGGFVQTDTGRIIIEIGGQTPDSEYDQLVITDAAEIYGKIVFEFIDGFPPSEGETFDFLNVTGTTDLTEARFLVRGLSSGWDYNITPTAGGVQLLSLSDAQAIPEPSSFLLVLAFAAAAVRTSRTGMSEGSLVQASVPTPSDGAVGEQSDGSDAAIARSFFRAAPGEAVSTPPPIRNLQIESGWPNLGKL